MKILFLRALTHLAFILTSLTSITIHAESNGSANNVTYTNKKTSTEFWSEFKQDSKQTWKDSKAAFKDGWIESKVATAIALNKYLDPFKIDIQVDNNIVTLEGEVSSDIEKELAENIALGVEGIDSVNNRLAVGSKPATYPEPVSSKGRRFSQYMIDVSTTAAIKTELIASKNVEGLAIDVDTFNNQVTLSGTVSSAEEKALAEAIAARHRDVVGVTNNLQFNSKATML